jgi:hypothetical protein
MKDDKLNKIVNSIIKAIDERMQKKPKAYYTEAEVLRVDKNNGVAYVHIPGGVDETPVRLTIDANEGDTVQIRVGEGSATITGNRTAPPTDDKLAEEALQEAQNSAKGLQKIDEALENGDFESAELTNIVTMYCLSTSNSQFIPATGYDWQTTPPAYVSGLYYWTKTVTTLDDGTEIETDPIFDLTAQAAAEADAIAKSNDNHFWHDSSGVYVTKTANNAASGYATRIVSEGIQHTYNGNPLFTLSSSALTFYQSNGSTPMATYGSGGTTLYANGSTAAQFLNNGVYLYDPSSTTYPAAQFLSSGAVIGRETSGNVKATSSGIEFRDGTTTLADMTFQTSEYFGTGVTISSPSNGSFGNGELTIWARKAASGGIKAMAAAILTAGSYIFQLQESRDTTEKSGAYCNCDMEVDGKLTAGSASVTGSLTAGNIDHGSVSITPTANTPTSKTVSFNKTFSSTPNVIISAETSVPYSTVRGCGATNISTTGFTAWVYRTNTTATVLHWIAIA